MTAPETTSAPAAVKRRLAQYETAEMKRKMRYDNPPHGRRLRGNRDRAQDVLHELPRGGAGELRLRVEHEAVGEHRHRHVADVFRRHELLAAHERERLRHAGERERGARAGAELHRWRVARGARELDGVALQLRADRAPPSRCASSRRTSSTLTHAPMRSSGCRCSCAERISTSVSALT